MKRILDKIVGAIASFFTPPSDSESRLAEVPRVPPAEVKRKLASGEALLVCAYEDEAKFRERALEGAISLQEFESRLPALSRAQEVTFYCA